ncbi:hypothetical protein EG68_07275 [Paragonimus skrjabini miyazakii]|uniref:Uncharacterized protein n=1 Tax=Paragonimus skrjabini miyazakii TaxID=59628 RepID=A0A8S9YC14_9TREM|nr:hypothetical protein EG68_07275 [Paragonimus skrjabini miyazakii]
MKETMIILAILLLGVSSAHCDTHQSGRCPRICTSGITSCIQMCPHSAYQIGCEVACKIKYYFCVFQCLLGREFA